MAPEFHKYWKLLICCIALCRSREKDELMLAEDRPRLDPDHEACNAIYEEAWAKCAALPPPGPDDIEQTSGSYFGGGCK